MTLRFIQRNGQRILQQEVNQGFGANQGWVWIDVPFMFASEGERVTCENGHIICTVARDIEHGSQPTGDEFKDWQQPEVAILGMAVNRIPPCQECGARWAGGAKGGIVHFRDGWR